MDDAISAHADVARRGTTAARASDDDGDYTTAVAQVIGGKDGKGRTVRQTTGECFDSVDKNLDARRGARAGRVQRTPRAAGGTR